MIEKYQWFNGLKFTRDDSTGYYLNSTIRKRMHRYVWEFSNGDIPKGFHIHHVDHDRGNNDISNLKMLSATEHETYHGLKRREENLLELQKRINYARMFASKWHGSADGREWHKKQSEKTKNRLFRKVDFICAFCGQSFTATKNGCNKFCSNKCKSAYRRKIGVDNENRICEWCGRLFTTNKYAKSKYCSLSCSNRGRNKIRKNKEYQGIRQRACV